MSQLRFVDVDFWHARENLAINIPKFSSFSSFSTQKLFLEKYFS